jgi:hypothetical protein
MGFGFKVGAVIRCIPVKENKTRPTQMLIVELPPVSFYI